jgi:TP901 family phage tail tape measure protein
MANNDSKASFKVYLDFQTTGKSIKDVDAEFKKLNNTIRRDLVPGTKAYNDAVAKQRELGKVLDDHRNKVKGVGGVWQSLSKEVKAFGMIAIGALGFQAITSQMGNMIRRNAELSDSLADVRKTTGMSEAQVKDLNKSLGQMDTRTSRKELLELAYAAGKLGNQGKENVLGFVRAADKIQVALGKDLGKDAITTIGKLVNVFGLKEKFGLEDGMLKIASAMNDLGMASEASEGYLAEFMKRMGGVAPLVKMSAPQTLALGATLDALGQTAEVSSTALSKLFIKFAEDSESFAKFAKMDVPEFKQLLEDDFLGAFIAVLDGVKDNSNGINELSATLGDLGVEGGRVVGVLGTLAQNTGMLRKQVDISNAAFEKGSSVIDEFNIKNENFAAGLEKMQKRISSWFANSGIMQSMNLLVQKFNEFLGVPMSEKIADERNNLNALVGSIMSVNDNQELRNSLIKQLQADYPDFIENIGIEALSNDYLAKRLDEVNKQYVNKIILQKKDEEIQKKQQAAAEQFMQTQKDIVDFSKRAASLEKKWLGKEFTGESMDERMIRLRQVAEGRRNNGGLGAKDEAQFELTKMYYNQVLEGEMKYQESLFSSKKELEDFQKLKKQLGIDDSTNTKDVLATNIASYKEFFEKMSEEQKKKHLKDKEELKKHLDELMRLRIDNMEDESAKAEAKADYEFYKLVTQAQKEITNKKVLNDTLIELQLQYDNKLAAIREDASKKRLDTLAQELDDYVKTEEWAQLELERAIVESLTGVKFGSKPKEDTGKSKFGVSEKRWGEVTEQGNETINAVADWGNAAIGMIDAVTARQRAELEEFLSQQEQKKRSIQDLYEAGKLSAEDYGKKVRAIDVESENKRREFGVKAARREKAIAIFNSIINTAAAIVKALPNVPLAVATGIMGTAQTGLIAATPIPAFAKGGSTFANGGGVMKPRLGLIGEKGPEWVAPNWMLRDPATADVIGALEAMRQNRTSAFADGGSTTSAVKTNMAGLGVGSNGELVSMMKSMQQTNMMLLDRLNKPFNGVIGWNDGDTRELEEKRTRYSDILNDNTLS